MAESIRNQVVKAHAILDALSTEHWSKAEDLAKLIGVGRQAITPYIKALRDLGHPIESVPGKGTRLSAELYRNPLLLCTEELTALFLALSRASGDFPESVLQRIQKRLLKSLSEQKQQEAQVLVNLPETEQPFFQDFRILEVLQKQLRGDSVVRVLYQGNKDKVARWRRVLPVEFIAKNKWWYLVIWELDDQGERHFRIDRIVDATVLPDKAELPTDFQRASMHPWDFGNKALSVELRLTKGLARWLSETPAHPSQKLQNMETETPTVSFEIACEEKFLDWLLGLRGFELLSPEPLQAKLKERAQILFETLGSLKVPWVKQNG